MTLQAKHIGPIVVCIFVVGIGGTMAFNLWRTESGKVPATYTAGEFEGEYNPADIRGSYSFSDISSAFEIPIDHLARAFGLDGVEDPAEFKCKELESLYGKVEGGEIGTDSVRLFVALYTGLPYTAQEDTLLFSPAISLLKDKLSEEQLAAVGSRAISFSRTASDSPAAHETEDRRLTGKTTFAELVEWGLTEEQIVGILKFAMGKPSAAVRDLVQEKGMEFSGVKNALQKLLDELP